MDVLAALVVLELDGERHAHSLQGRQKDGDAVGVHEPTEDHGVQRQQFKLGKGAFDLELGPARPADTPAGGVEHLGRALRVGYGCEGPPYVAATVNLRQGSGVEAWPACPSGGEVHAGR